VDRRLPTLALVLALSACGQGVQPAAVPSPSPSPAVTTTAPSPTVAPVRPPVVARFGAVNGLLSVEIDNPNAAVGVRETGFVLRAYSKAGTLLGTGGQGPLGDRCCTVFALPPGGKHGLFLELGPYADRVARVEVTLAKPRWVRWTGVTPVSATAPHMESYAPAVVSATLSARAKTDASVQAFLDDGSGHLVGVVSAIVRCVGPRAREVPLNLYRAVPRGTKVGSVVAYPLDRPAHC
jgi:hypothetical protein